MLPRTNLLSGLASRNVLHLSICQYYAATSPQIQQWRAKNAKDLCSKQAYVYNLKCKKIFNELQASGTPKIFKPNDTIINSEAVTRSWSQVVIAQAALVSFTLLCVSV